MAIISGSALRVEGVPIDEEITSGSEFSVELEEGPGYITLESKRDNDGFYTSSPNFASVSGSNLTATIYNKHIISGVMGNTTSGSLSFVASRDIPANDIRVKVATPVLNPKVNVGGGVDERFIITVKTDNAGTSASNQFTIPTTSGTYNYDIVTSDGQTFTGETGDKTITFATAGDYDIKISGTFPRIYFNNTGDKDKLIAVKNLGVVGWTSFLSAFFGCSNLETFISGNTDTSSVLNMSYMFRDCTSLTGLDVSNWDVSSVTGMYNMFRDCTSLTNIDVSNWDVSSVTRMDIMFFNCTSLTNIDVSNWDVSSVANMNLMFYNCDGFDNNLSLWDITAVTNFNFFMLLATGLSTVNYDATLIGWEATLQAAFPNGVGYTPTLTIYFGGSQYTAGGAADTARQSLINNFNWIIVDGGSI